jgi:hypothetical protein
MTITTFPTDDKELEELLLKLTVFAVAWTKGRGWFRGRETSTFLEGKEPKDYVYEAIGRFLKHPEKYDPSKGGLLEYLKYNILRSLVSNDLRSEENRKTDDLFAYEGEEENENEHLSYLDRVLPYAEALFPDDIDYANVKAYIENEIRDDKDADRIFLGVYAANLKRREIMEEFDMSAEQYNNGMRRLMTVLNRAKLHFTNKPTV